MNNGFFEQFCKENFIVNFEGDLHTFTEGVAFTSSSQTFSEGEITFETKKNNENATITAENIKTGVEVVQHYEFFGDVIRQHNTVKNKKNDEKQLINISSAMLAVPYKGLIPWNDERRFRLHVCKLAWSVEAQWHSGSLTDFGLNPIRFLESGMQGPGRIVLSSKGSWSTGVYYPLVILEDLEKGEAYFMEHEGGLSWKITLGFWGDCIVLDCTSADINLDGFFKKLAKGESFTTTKAVYGKVDGGFEEAVKALTAYKRAATAVQWKNNIPLVCYNVFMGGIYGLPNEDNLKALIPAAAKIGCEVFCIDAGWFREPGDTSYQMGDYRPNDKLFGADGLAGIIKMISDYNMIPGLWFEFEAGGEGSVCAKLSGNTMHKRNGKVISAEHGFLDLSNPDVREYLFGEIDRVYKMGVRYIKNDYNYSTGIGVNTSGGTYNENERARAAALTDFIDEIYTRCPDMIIENCGSGGMREDGDTLAHFHVQSTSDQELYYNYAPIAAASTTLMPPEKAGNWANPYFVREDENEAFVKNPNPSLLQERNKSGEETVFSMINGMVGVPFISGRIDCFDEKNLLLAKEGVEVYKEMRADIAKAYPVFPTGTATVGKREYVTLGLINGENAVMYLAVWNVNAYQDEIMLDLSKYVGQNASVEMIYPRNDEKCRFTYANALRRLTVKTEGEKYMARLFKIKGAIEEML